MAVIFFATKILLRFAKYWESKRDLKEFPICFLGFYKRKED
jgi:hypothetical protein